MELAVKIFAEFKVDLVTKAVIALFILTVTNPINANPQKELSLNAVITSVSVLSQNSKLRSVKDKDLVVIRVPAIDNQGKIVPPNHKFLLQGCLHGDEELACLFVAWLAQRTAAGKSALNQLSGHRAAFDFVPVANPDGYKKGERSNSRNVNLNRNFGVMWGKTRENPGHSAFSEPETQAIKFLLESQKYTVAVDVHGYANWIVAPSKLENQDSLTSARYSSWTSILNSAIAFLNKNRPQSKPYELKTAGGLGDGGAFEDWVFWETGTFAFCLEIQGKSRFMPNVSGLQTVSHGIRMLDLFEVYEQTIYQVFKNAIELKNDKPTRSLVSNT